MATSDELPIVDLTALTALYRSAISATTSLSVTAMNAAASTTLTTTPTTAAAAAASATLTTIASNLTTASNPSTAVTTTTTLSSSPATDPFDQLSSIPMGTTRTTTIQYITDDRHLVTASSGNLGVVNRVYVSDEELPSPDGSTDGSRHSINSRRSSNTGGDERNRRLSNSGGANDSRHSSISVGAINSIQSSIIGGANGSNRTGILVGAVDSRRTSISGGADSSRHSSIIAGIADSRRSSIYSLFGSADCSRRSSAASPPPAYQALFFGNVFPVDTSIPLQPSLPDLPMSPSRRRSRGGLQGELLTLKSRPSIDLMAADPAIVSRYPSLQHFSSPNEIDALPATTTDCCNFTKSELACWVLTIACISMLAIGLVVYLISTDWSRV